MVDGPPDDQYARLREHPMTQILWIASSTADCYGYPPQSDNVEEPWCIYDGDEDDPPIADGMFMEAAEFVAEALNVLPGLLDTIEAQQQEIDRLADAKRLLAQELERVQDEAAARDAEVQLDEEGLQRTLVANERLKQAAEAVAKLCVLPTPDECLVVNAEDLNPHPYQPVHWPLWHEGDGVWSHRLSGESGSLGQMLQAIASVYLAKEAG